MNISKAKILSLLDLTSLNDDDTPAVIDALCRNATQAIGKVAAVCVYPPFVAQSRARLPANCGINVATVVNFPTGDEPLADVLAQTQQALADGANEIDLVFPYKALQQGNAAAGEAMCSQIATLVHQHSGSLKVILGNRRALARTHRPSRANCHCRRRRFFENVHRQNRPRRKPRSQRDFVRPNCPSQATCGAENFGRRARHRHRASLYRPSRRQNGRRLGAA